VRERERDAGARLSGEGAQTSVSCKHVQLLDPAVVPWFPTRIEDTDEFANEVCAACSSFCCSSTF
jgi:hypothetical protein